MPLVNRRPVGDSQPFLRRCGESYEPGVAKGSTASVRTGLRFVIDDAYPPPPSSETVQTAVTDKLRYVDRVQLAAEQRARMLIDRQLADAGWAVQHRKDLNLFAGQGVAVREVIMATLWMHRTGSGTK